MIRLVVGLGNPGDQYEATRHNAGFAYVDALARAHGGTWKRDRKLGADSTEILLDGQKVTLLKPMAYMNRSGRAVAALAGFYKWTPEAILVAHDELDLPPGVARFKKAGGHGGHNGLRDIIAHLGNRKDFHRVRIGIGHPGQARDVVNYVLSRAAPDEQRHTDEAIAEAVAHTPLFVAGQCEQAMTRLHSFRSQDA